MDACQERAISQQQSGLCTFGNFRTGSNSALSVAEKEGTFTLRNARSRMLRGERERELKVIYSRREARIDLCDFLLQNTTEFF